MIEILPITQTQVDWQKYLTVLKNLLNQNPTTQLDDHGMSPDNLASFVITLGQLRDFTLKPNEIFNNPDNFLRHLSFGFLILAPEFVFIEFIEQCSFAVTSMSILPSRLGVVTGTLEQWHTAINNYCSVSSTIGLRQVFNKLLLYFESVGFGRLWWNQQKITQNDKTFVLQDKR